MISLTGYTGLLLVTLLAVCFGQDSTPDVCNRPPVRVYSLADREESVQTGTIGEVGYIMPPESGSWCNNYPNTIYRTNDGTCNHLNNLGASSKTLDRLLPPDYDDGFDSPRQRGKDGQPLPSARNISLTVHPPRDASSGFPIILMQWGQWTAHDLVATATTLGDINCCGANAGCPPFVKSPRCFPIEVPKNDPTLPGICQNFLRSLAANGSDHLPSRPREQISTVTSFLDGSQIYGSSDDVAALVRERGGFLLRTKNGDFPPESNDSCIKKPGTDEYCFQAGDHRANQHTYLSALHTLWLREHNYIATRLRELKKTATNEEIFQITRKIIIGMLQIITYNNYLPIVLGKDANRWGLTSTSCRSAYNPSLNPTVFTEFSTAGFRYGHSTIPSLFPIGNNSVPLRFLFNRPSLVLVFFQSIIAGMVGKSTASDKSIQSADRFFTEEMSRFLFFNNNTRRGLDIVSNNIQRGRDHGLPPYVKLRLLCGLRPLTGFNDTEALGPYASELAKIYRSIYDIDLYTGMLHEPVDTGIVGPTIRCLLRMQFFRTKYADRHFVDHKEPNVGFTDAQLDSLRTVTLSQVMCRHTSLKSIQKDAFRLSSTTNPDVPCEIQKTQGVNLTLFA